MNDFSIFKVLKLAFNALFKNFTDIFIVTVFAASSVLVTALLLNSSFLGRVNALMNAAFEGNALQSAAFYNPLVLFSFYIGFLAFFAAFTVFCMFSLVLPLCESKIMKLRNLFPSPRAAAGFALPALVLFAAFELISVVFPAVAKAAAGEGGYNAGVFMVSVVSFAAIALSAFFALKYFFFFLPLLENAGLKAAFKKSAAVTAGRRTKVFIFLALLFIINYSAKYFILLLLLTVPFSVLAVTYAYLELSGLDFDAGGAVKAG